MRRSLPLLVFALLALVPVRAEGPGAIERTLDIRIDATGGGTDLGVELVAAGVEKGTSFYVKQVVDSEIYRFSEPSFFTQDGAPVAHELLNARFTVPEAPDETLVVRYRVTPGGKARHGHQGLVTKHWAGFDGRAVLQPKEIAAYDEVRWHFDLPEDWVVASSMLAIDEDSWRMPPMEPRYRASMLKSLCVGLGPFAEETRRLGDTDFRVFTMKRWEDGAELADGAHGVFRWFHDELGFDPGRPFALVWTPPGPEWSAVWSGSGATATCYERPQKGFHNWELLGHRVGHPINEYAPDGFGIAKPQDHWFMEGWATYVERPALAASGVADLGRLNALYKHHKDEVAEHPDWADFRLADEPQARGELVENLHYRRGPLVATMLSDQVERRTGKSFEQFMRHVIATHKGFQKGLDLRAELASWSGQPFDDFWAVMVDEPGPVVPVWEEYEQALPAKRPGAALRAGELTWSGDQLYGLLRSGQFRTAGELGEALRETGRKHAELKRRGVSVLPPKLASLRTAFPADVRGDVDALERAWPLEGGPTLPSGGCAGAPGPLPTPDLVAAGADGEVFLALLRAEKKANWHPSGTEGLRGLRFGIDDWAPPVPGSAMAFSSDEKLRVLMSWVAPHPGMRLEIWDGDERVAKRWVELQSDWNSTWTRLGPEAVENTHIGVLDVRLVHEGKVVGNRPVWRRQASPSE